ncbi:MAG: branched-chain amino acid ABC transporter permease [Chitinivibrionales bacterium]|nr:branched-chain amino acid ABC transporter permease [Chitinivibrionales bacterium]
MLKFIAQQLTNGIQLGSIYALIALGYSMIYGIVKLINFAHADIFMVGAYIALFTAAFAAGAASGGGAMPPLLWFWVGLALAYLCLDWATAAYGPLRALSERSRKKRAPGRSVRQRTLGYLRYNLLMAGALVLLAALFGVLLTALTKTVFGLRLGAWLLGVILVWVMAVCAIVGMAMEHIAYRPLRHKPRVLALITALGVSLFLENFCSQAALFGNQYRAFPEIIKKTVVVYVPALDLAITNIFIVNLAVAGLMLLLLWFIVEKTLVGKQMRAVACNTGVAALMGINVDNIITLTFCIGPALAGVAGVLYAVNYGILQSPFLGFTPGIKAFIAAVLGGIGSLPGAVLGALLLGVTEVFANAVDSNLGFALAFVILIVMLLVRPAGLLGKKEIEKV